MVAARQVAFRDNPFLAKHEALAAGPATAGILLRRTRFPADITIVVRRWQNMARWTSVFYPDYQYRATRYPQN